MAEVVETGARRVFFTEPHSAKGILRFGPRCGLRLATTATFYGHPVF
jgi:hypothetical protein